VDFDIPLRYQKTADGQRYLLADRIQRSGEEVEKRLIIFSSQKSFLINLKMH